MMAMAVAVVGAGGGGGGLRDAVDDDGGGGRGRWWRWRWTGAMVVMAVGAGDCGGGWGCMLFQAPWCESAGSGWSAAPVAALPPRRPPPNSLVPAHHRQAPAQSVPLEGGGANGPLIRARSPRRTPPNTTSCAQTAVRYPPEQAVWRGWPRSGARIGVVSASASFVRLHSRLKLRRHPPHARHALRTRPRRTLDNRLTVQEYLPRIRRIHAYQER